MEIMNKQLVNRLQSIQKEKNTSPVDTNDIQGEHTITIWGWGGAAGLCSIMQKI